MSRVPCLAGERDAEDVRLHAADAQVAHLQEGHRGRLRAERVHERLRAAVEQHRGGGGSIVQDPTAEERNECGRIRTNTVELQRNPCPLDYSLANKNTCSTSGVSACADGPATCRISTY